MLNIIRRPLISEKNATHMESSNTFAFEVLKEASKTDIKKAIESAFDVKVVSVRTLIQRGHWFRKSYRVGAPKTTKKALVKLRDGDKISLFEGV